GEFSCLGSGFKIVYSRCLLYRSLITHRHGCSEDGHRSENAGVGQLPRAREGIVLLSTKAGSRREVASQKSSSEGEVGGPLCLQEFSTRCTPTQGKTAWKGVRHRRFRILDCRR